VNELALYQRLLEQLSLTPVVRAILVASWGSTPREVGAKMVVLPDGTIWGTVGGGCGEAEVWQAAMEIHQEHTPRRVEVDLTESEESDSGKVCGGRFEVFLDYWEAGGAAAQALSRAFADQLALVTPLGSPPPRNWKKQAPLLPFLEPGSVRAEVDRWQLSEQGHPRLILEAGQECLVEMVTVDMPLYIAGAGHIARPLSQMALLCGYQVTVVDDRPEYAQSERFPGATVVCSDFAEFFSQIEHPERASVVLVTRGHKHDQDCLRQLYPRSLRYLGMIGSKRRTRAVLQELVGEGLDQPWLDQIFAPIGLDIGALSPEEIAVAILGEMILLRRGGSGGSLRRSKEKRDLPAEQS
jgi:xanthine dehydrogenase accessory factor